MSSMKKSVLGILLILTIVLCASFIISKKTEFLGGIDLTENKLYTLTEGSQNIIDKLQKPVTMKLFYAKEGVTRVGSDQLLAFNNYYFYIRDLLASYARHSDGKVKVEEFDPRPFSDAEMEADRLQIQRHQLTEKEGFYFGLAVTTEAGAQETIKFFHPAQQAQVEYKISELIDMVSRKTKTKVGVLSSLEIASMSMTPYMRQMMQMQGQQIPEPWAVITQLRKFYDITNVAKDADTIEADVDYLIVVHPKALPEKTLYAVDQFIMRGGKMVVFQDPFCYYADQAPQNPQNPYAAQNHSKASDLSRLLSKWGVAMAANQFSGDLAIAQKVGQRTPVRFPGVMTFRDADCLNADEVVVQGLEDITMLFAGALTKVEGGESTVTSLISTTKSGNSWGADPRELGGRQGPNIGALIDRFESGSSEVMVAAKITGKLSSAFPEGKPKSAEAEAPEGEPKKEDETDTHIAENKADSAIIVVADVDMITDNGAFQRTFFGMSPSNSNASFVLNALDHLAGSPDLMSIRSRGGFRRPFTLVDAIEKEADIATADKIKQINADKKRFQDQLAELQSKATQENVGLLESQALTKRRDAEAKIREKDRELREVQSAKLESIESLGNKVKFFSIGLVPIFVLLAGFLLLVIRNSKRRTKVLGGA